jgi:hypothetical protein
LGKIRCDKTTNEECEMRFWYQETEKNVPSKKIDHTERNGKAPDHTF